MKLTQEFLDSISSGINKTPCPFCGKSHFVRLNLSQSRAQSSGVISEAFFGSDEDVVTFGFDESACEAFKARSLDFIKDKIKNL
jgi:hypothetical protein